jgi:hypothetical protein
MKNVLLFLLGVAGGFVLAHLVDKDPRGHEILAEVDSRISEFTDRIGDAYREQESRFTGFVDEVKDAVDEAGSAAKAAASDAVDAAAQTARKLTD